MTKEHATQLIETYGKAWVAQDPDLILSIFTEDATYDDPHEPINNGREGIRAYWVSKVVEGQKDIHFSLQNIWVHDDMVIAEWQASFIDTIRNLRIEMTEVALFTVRDDLFSSLREYYKSTKTPL